MSPATFDPTRVDAVLQLALAAAAQEDDFRDRELGPIHLVKYVYLADLAYAEVHGETFTGAGWRFYHFGPFAGEVLDRLAPATQDIGCDEKRLRSAYDSDFVRYRLDSDRADGAFRRLERELPGLIFGAVRRTVHEFGADTATLLRHVYLTRPVLQAAPNEPLVFERAPQPGEVGQAPERPAAVPRSVRERRRLRVQQQERRAHVRALLHEKLQKRPHPATPSPRYDEVYAEGLAWLEHAAGEPPAPGEGELVIDPTMWKSSSRQDPDVP